MWLGALETDDADDAFPSLDGHAEPRLGISATDLDRPATDLLIDRREAQGPARANDRRGDPLAESHHAAVEWLPLIDVVRKGERGGIGVVERDEHPADGEDRAHPIADELDDRLELELVGQRLADLVDQRQLGVAF